MKDKIIAKQEELIHQLSLHSMELDMPEILSKERLDKINKISMGILHLESELAQLKAEADTKEPLNTKPTLCERYADNGEHSHWELVNTDTGETLWDEADAQEKEVSDEDIEKWANNDIGTEKYYRGKIVGAKAHRDNLIKKG